jgi:hypothetical protein
VMAVDALKRANLESDPRALDAHQDHLDPNTWDGYGPNRYAACVEQDLMPGGVGLGPDNAIPRWLPAQQICPAIACSKFAHFQKGHRGRKGAGTAVRYRPDTVNSIWNSEQK